MGTSIWKGKETITRAPSRSTGSAGRRNRLAPSSERLIELSDTEAGRWHPVRVELVAEAKSALSTIDAGTPHPDEAASADRPAQ